MRVSLARALLVAVLLALAMPAAGLAIVCPNIPLNERLASADAAFVGTITAIDTRSGSPLVTFRVRQKVKGPVAGVAQISADAALTDSTGRRLPLGTTVGVFVVLDGPTFTTTSCLLTDPAALLATADEPKGGAIKVVIGIVILLAVVAWAIVRRRRGIRPALGQPHATPKQRGGL
jgi:hypothetical protein